ncbi:glycosyltransferase family 4 protein [Spirosoma agri]|uniref:Glycosyltransferase family 4 protein n=1 Tax=Spirosoma agri TaxID=1987381 RepID=A0A6M0IRN8_9BACT|nr:glycosyltransferase family 4 protein [Spirosoma agri]
MKPVDSTSRFYTLFFVSSCPEDWGGSEELWAQAAILLAQAGHCVHVFKTNVKRQHPRIQALLAANCTVTDLYQVPSLRIRLRNRLLPIRWQHTTAQRGQQILRQALLAQQPHLTLVAQGNNYDGAAFADVCRRYEHPFALVAQKAVHFLFPYDHERAVIQAAYQSALKCFFVSQHNLELTRRQLSMRLPQAEVVFNPVNPFVQEAFVSPIVPQIAQDGVIRLACVARLDVLDKGQDLLLTVLAQPKWRSRPITVTMYGAGPHRKAIEELVLFLNLDGKVSLGGHVPNPAVIWQTHHALVLPSRSEGLPLALVEAMLCSRPAIATDAGGIAELLINNQTGFLASTPSVEAIDEALERAWHRRDEWQQMGVVAAQHARATVSSDAAQSFSKHLLRLTASLGQ